MVLVFESSHSVPKRTDMNCGSIRYIPKIGKYKITGIDTVELDMFDYLLTLWLEDFRIQNRQDGGRFGDVQEFIIRGIKKTVQKQLYREFTLKQRM